MSAPPTAPRSRRAPRPRRGPKLERFAIASSIRTVRTLAPAIRLVGGDPDAVEALLGAQLKVEFRRQRVGTERTTFVTKLGGQLLLGMLFGFSLLFVRDAKTWMTFAQGAVLIFTVFGTLEAVPHLLVDRKDLAVVGSAPIRDMTFFVARLLEIIVVVGLVILSLALPMGLAGLVLWPPGPFLAAYVLSTLLSGALALFATLILYLAVLRLLPAHRARDVILFAQVSMTIVIFGSIQIAARLADREAMAALLTTSSPVHWLLPPVYYGELFRGCLGEVPLELPLLVLAFAVPAAAAFGAFAIASSGLLERMQQATAGGSGARERRGRRRDTGARGRLDPIVRRLLPDPIERVGFDQFRLLSRRERGFRLRTYPTLALSVIFATGYLIGYLRDGPPVSDAAFLSLPVYFAFLYAPIFVLQARYSDDGEARWIFDVAPIERPGGLIAGMAVGVALCFLIPVSTLIAVVVLTVGGVAVIPHLLVGIAFIGFATLFTVERVGPGLPFSEPFRPQVGMTNFGLLMLTGFVQGGAIGVHLGMAQVPFGMPILFVLYLALGRLWLGRLRRLRPSEVEVRWFPKGRRRRAISRAQTEAEEIEAGGTGAGDDLPAESPREREDR